MDKQKKQLLIVKSCLLIAALVSSFYLLMLGWYNTLSLDDYGFVADIEQQGHWDYMKDMYLHWQGRFSAFFVSSYLIPIFGRMPNMLPYTVFQMDAKARGPGIAVFQCWERSQPSFPFWYCRN